MALPFYYLEIINSKPVRIAAIYPFSLYKIDGCVFEYQNQIVK